MNDGFLGSLFLVAFLCTIAFFIVCLVLSRKIKCSYNDVETFSTLWKICFAISFVLIITMPVACIMVLHKYKRLAEMKKTLAQDSMAVNSKIESMLSLSEQDELLELREYVTNIQPMEMIDDLHVGVIEKLHSNGGDVPSYVNKIVLNALETNIIHILDEGEITPEDERFVNDFLIKSKLALSSELMMSRYYANFIQGLCLRDIKEGKRVERVQVDELPVLLQKNEDLLWVYQNVEGFQLKKGRKYVGGSNGYSMRICKGVYYRIGASKGHSVSYEYKESMGKGALVITSKHVIFSGATPVKIPIAKMISVTPYSDGVEIVKDGANPKPYTFVGCDSWFIVNAINLLV